MFDTKGNILISMPILILMAIACKGVNAVWHFMIYLEKAMSHIPILNWLF